MRILMDVPDRGSPETTMIKFCCPFGINQSSLVCCSVAAPRLQIRLDGGNSGRVNAYRRMSRAAARNRTAGVTEYAIASRETVSADCSAAWGANPGANPTYRSNSKPASMIATPVDTYWLNERIPNSVPVLRLPVSSSFSSATSAIIECGINQRMELKNPATP